MHHTVFPVLTLEKKCINRVHKGMIDNPIYVGGSGPVYDSIVTQPERIQSTGSDQKDTCITNPHYESLHIYLIVIQRQIQIATLVNLSSHH